MIIFFLYLILSFVCFLLGVLYNQNSIRKNLDGCINIFSNGESRDSKVAYIVLKETYKLLFEEDSRY